MRMLAGALASRAAVTGRARRYLVALALCACGFVVMVALWSRGVETFAPVVGMVAIACWYAGADAGLVGTLAAFGAAWVALSSPRGSFGGPDGVDLVAWLAPLVVALIVVSVSWAMSRAGTRAEVRADSAERDRSATEGVQRLATGLSSAVTPSDVAHMLVEHLPALLGSTGAAVGLVADGGLRIVDPAGAPRQTLSPGLWLPLETRAPITTAARTGAVVFAATRDRFVEEYPDGAALAPDAAGALAVPLHAAGTVVGSMGFPFARPWAIDDDVLALARLAADLGGQALERAGLYEQERQMREGLDRILRLAPLFDSESPEAVVQMVCSEAIATFGSDVAQVWANGGDGMFDVVWRQPPDSVIPPGLRVAVTDIPGLAESMERLESMFIPDSWQDVQGMALAHARHFGIRSSLRVPIAVGGRAERVLVLQWKRVLANPPASTIGLARRFADQAGLALEHAERHVAQEAASRNAEETRRLLGVTAALAAAIEPAAVADAILREGLAGLGASTGDVVRVAGDGHLVRIAPVGDVRAQVGGVGERDASAPLTDAIRRGELVALESGAERSRRYPGGPHVEASRPGASLAVPLVAGGRVVGGLELFFDVARPFSDGDREFGLALSRQGGQALERSVLLETEHEARLRAERMASDLAQLHALATSLGRAGDAADVTHIVGEQLVHGVRASGAGVYTLDSGGDELSLLDVWGRLDRADLPPSDGGASRQGPIALAARTARPVWLVDGADWSALPAALAWRVPGVGALGAVPLVVEQRVVGVLFVVFDDAHHPSDEDRRFVEIVARQAAQPLERSRLFDEERAMRRRADQLTELTTSLSGALSPDDVVDVFLRQVSASVDASAVAMGVLDEEHRVPSAATWRGDDALVPASWLDSARGRRTPLQDAVEAAELRYFESSAALLAAYPDAAELAAAHPLGAFAFVPVVAGRRALAVTVLAWDAPSPLTGDEQALIATIASQCGQALDRAQRYEIERTIAETLQRSVLPETLPSMEGATVAARYLPGTAAMDVGGDWFDTIPLADGRLAFVVGDVVGKGVQAAATMAQLRNGMRALTLDSSDPGPIVTKLNRLLDGSTDSPFATVALLTVDPVTHEAELVSAGHLPPLVVTPAGEIVVLEGGRGVPLGVDPDTIYEGWPTTLEAGSMIVLYTDGLVERRDRSLDDGLALLAETAAGAPRDPHDLVDRVISRLVGDADRGDDIAVLAVALDLDPLGAFRMRLPADRESLVQLRDAFGLWLDRGGISETDRRDLILAAWEAGANAVEHARDPAEPLIGVEASLVGDRVRVAVSDTGTWREPLDRPDRGLGLRLIQALMTTLTVEQDEGGTRVVMERALSRERAGEGGETCTT